VEAIGEGTVSVDGVGVFVRRREGAGTPVVFVHGDPTHSQDWLPFLERLDRPAIALDLPGWGRSARPADFDYSMHGLARFYAQFLRTLGVQRHSLVVHDWGSVALIAAQREPQQLERLVVIDAVPLLEGYRWHWVARWFWRVPVVGEGFNALTSRPATKLLLRQATGDRGPMPESQVDLIWRYLDRGTRHAILRLYRSAGPSELAAAGADLECPALVVWSDRDAYLPLRLAAPTPSGCPTPTSLQSREAATGRGSSNRM
jgi:pimeloyl-ACP methyl ester carboxylesterase